MPHRLLWLAIVTAACSHSYGTASDGRSWSQHMESARQHDEAARQHELAVRAGEHNSKTEPLVCGDTVLNDQSTSGGMKLTYWQPCWDPYEEAAIRHRYAAKLERIEAQRDRRAAAALVEAEVAACRPLPPGERGHSVFAHRKEVAAVVPIHEDGVLRGARVVFAPVVALTAPYMRAAIACEHARWEVFGRDPAFSPFDPTLIEGVQIDVVEHADHVEVVVTSRDPADAAVVLDRARKMARGRTL